MQPSRTKVTHSAASSTQQSELIGQPFHQRITGGLSSSIRCSAAVSGRNEASAGQLQLHPSMQSAEVTVPLKQ